MVGEHQIADGRAERVRRRLAAVVSADVAGYSRLVERDEEGTVRRLRQIWDTVVRPSVESHGGRVVKLMGDGALIEFGSVVEAVKCALDVQTSMAALEASRETQDRITYRIGIHLGDVIVDGDDIQGHGVNVAARLECLAAPGGICISEAVRAALGSAIPLAYQDLGAQEVKNLAEPVHAYRAAAGVPARYHAPGKRSRRRSNLARAFAAALLVALVAATALYFGLGREGSGDASNLARMAEPNPIPHTAGVPAIAVMPFLNLSGDEEQEFFVDGLTEDLIVDLSRLSNLLVIARNSSFTYKNQTVSPQQVAADLGVTHVLNGSVRRVAGRVRITAQLVDAVNDRQIWAQRFDREMTDIFAVEDEVNREIIAALALKLGPGEATKVSSASTTSIEAYEYFVRGRQAMNFVSRRSLRLAYYAFEQAIALDPAFAEAYAQLAMTYAIDLTGTSGSWSDWVRPPGRARAQAAVLAEKATSLQPGLGTPELVLARLSLAEWHYDSAIAHARRAVERQPGAAEAYATLALALTAAGQHGDALQAVQEALRRDPKPPPATYGILGIIQFALHDYTAAVQSLGKSVEEMIDDGGWFYSPFLLASYGRPAELGQHREQAFRETSLASVRFNQFYEQAEDMQHLLSRLRLAGAQEFSPEFDARRDDAEQIPGRHLAALLYGRSFESLCWFPRLNAEFSFAANGAVSWTARQDISDLGTSRIDGNQICVRLPTITRDRDACSSVFKIKGSNYLTKNYDFVLAGPSLCYFRRKG